MPLYCFTFTGINISFRLLQICINNEYPDFLNQIKFHTLPCSGSTVEGLAPIFSKPNNQNAVLYKQNSKLK